MSKSSKSHDGSQWMILDYPYQGMVQLENSWYPKISPQVNVYDVRRSIEQWIEPIQQYVPAPPPGVDYSAMRVKIVDGPGTYGSGDELSPESKNIGSGW